MHSEVELLVDAHAAIGEAPLWCEEEAALYWIDVKAPALYRTKIDTGSTRSWPLPADIGGYALNPNGSGAVVGLRIGIFALDFTTGTVAPLCKPPFDPNKHRFNEGDCDRSGRLWLGTMFDPQIDCPPEKQELYSFTLSGGLERHGAEALLHNGFAWNAASDEFYIAHTREGRIYAYAFDLKCGALGERRLLAEVDKETGVPDGGAIDCKGFYWSAIHGGGCLHRYAPDGRLDAIIELPVRNPTMMAFCGPGLRELCVTTASHRKPGAPHEGGVFRLRPGFTGQPRRAHLC
ncbi:MAG TPA: SMP-30/gluconolactonase/LRE family protein [Gemmataceae bacterium]|nr:SMP-30/gluconolactonase/LRE family protein [Gemmataceae bacterium]